MCRVQSPGCSAKRHLSVVWFGRDLGMRAHNHSETSCTCHRKGHAMYLIHVCKASRTITVSNLETACQQVEEARALSHRAQPEAAMYGASKLPPTPVNPRCLRSSLTCSTSTAHPTGRAQQVSCAHRSAAHDGRLPRSALPWSTWTGPSPCELDASPIVICQRRASSRATDPHDGSAAPQPAHSPCSASGAAPARLATNCVCGLSKPA
jgi:hypothetical protein